MQTMTDIKLRLGESEERLFQMAERALGRKPKTFRILKKSLDARKKEDIRWVYSIGFSAEEEEKEPPRVRLASPPRVVIVGSGPAGLFCALRLIEYGAKPIVLERGKCVEERAADNERFFSEHQLEGESNIQFGEGGAGTFSDGKLYSQTNSPQNRNNADVFRLFVQFGAPEEIAYLSKPHIGSDRLRVAVRNMREYIRAQGGEVRFSAKMTDLMISDGRAVGVIVNGREELRADAVVLAVGHSAPDTFSMLEGKLFMEQKEFAVGLRVEHLQSEIGKAQYGAAWTRLPTADYKLVSHASERGCVSFCMCPGGYVIPAASEEGGVVTNGMSNYARDAVNANSALVVQVKKADFDGSDPLAGVRYQRALERKAFELGGGDYRAPAQLVGDFLRGRVSDGFGAVRPSYAAGVRFAPLSELLPEPIANSLLAAIPDMDRRLRGFASPDAVLTGVESRTSSPVRICRGEDMQSVSCAGAYPCGEGCGYAGGITSSAADGLRVADAIARQAADGFFAK